MPDTPQLPSDRELLRRIGRSAGAKAGYKQLVRELGLGGGRERRLLVERLDLLVSRRELASPRPGIWALPGREELVAHLTSAPTGPQAGDTPRHGRDRLISGRLDLHRDGFGFVRPDAPSRERPAEARDDIFIPPHEIHGAMQGDLVLVDEEPRDRNGRRSGRIARVLTRRDQTLVGIFHAGQAHGRRPHPAADAGSHSFRGNYVLPLDDRLGGPIEIPEGMEQVPEAATSAHRTLEPSRRKAVPSRGTHALEGLAVDVEITSFAQAGRPARGRILEVLGHPDDFGVDTEIVIRKHHLPHVFPAPVLAEAEDRSRYTPEVATPEELTAREDFRALPIVTIDGESARDFDDAVLVRTLANGNTELQVHIADVSLYVLPGSALDTEARVRGTSAYFPDRAVPMLPHALSSGMCSLRPDEDRFVLSCIMEVDPQGEIAAFRVGEGLIRSARRFTYTSVQQCLNASPEASTWNNTGAVADGNASGRAGRSVTPAPTAEDFAERERVATEAPELPAAVDRMLQLALALNAKRARRGSIDFDLPEPVVQFDPDGNMKAIVRSERGWAHRLIEEFMLSANECIATWLESLGIPSIYRIHEMPDPKRILDFEETAAGFGQTLGVGALPVRRLTIKADRRDNQRRSVRGQSSRPAQTTEIPERIPVTPQMYRRLVRRIVGKPEERILAYLMLRSLKQARYAEKNEGHFALASPSYTHFTSPIRRYPDLIVHRLVREMLRQGADPQGGPIRSDQAQPWTDSADRPQPRQRKTHLEPIAATELADIATESSQAERRAADAERELIEWKKMKFMADKIGDDFRGIVLSVTKFGFFVELDELFIEGLVPLASLTYDHYAFRDTDRTLCGARTGHCFAAGQRVEVILDRIDRQQRRLQFALLPGTEPQGNGPRPLRKRDKEHAPAKRKAKASSKSKRR